MKNKRMWLSMGLALIMLCTMLLAPGGWSVPPAQAVVYHTNDRNADAFVYPTQMHPDPATQTITLTYGILLSDYNGHPGEWYICVNRKSDAEGAAPLNNLKKSLTSEKKDGKISGSWSIHLWNMFGANKPIPAGEYEFRIYGPFGLPNVNFGVDVYQDYLYNITTFSVVNNNDAILNCPALAAPGDKITVSWQNASKNPFAWIGFYKKDANSSSPISKIFINQNTSLGNKWTLDTSTNPVTTGEYEFRIFQDSGYTRNGTANVQIRYKTPNITVNPEQGRIGETIAISWTDGPNYNGYDKHRVGIYSGDQLYTNLQTGIWPEQTINYKLRNEMPPGMYTVKMINGLDGSVMGSKNFGVQAAAATNATNTTTTTPAAGAATTTGTAAGNQSPLHLTAAASGQSIVLNWTPPANTAGLTGYYIYRGTKAGGESTSPLRDFPVAATTITDSTVSSGTYYYIVKPVYGDASTGAASNEASATVGGRVSIVLQVGNPYMTVNGVQKEIDPGQGTAPALVDDRVFVPIRAIVEALGGTVSYTASEQKLTINLGTTVIDLWIGQTTAKVNGVTKTLDAAPFVSDTGRTMLPLRFVIENLGCQVQWDGANQKVTISYAGGGVAPSSTTTTTTPATTTPTTIITTPATTTITNTTVIPGTPAGNGISGLVAQYKLNGDSKDASGKGNDGTVVGDVSFVDDSVVGKCAVFNGGYLTVKSNPSLNLGTNFTISVWVKVDPTMAIPHNKNGSIISKLDDRAVYNNLHWYTKGTYGIGADLRTNVGDKYNGERTIQNKAFTDYKMHLNWTHLVFSGDGQNLNLYCNGSLISTKAIGTGVSITPSNSDKSDMRIGTGNDINNKNLIFIGRMADLRIYNRTLGQNEITNLYSGGAAR